jgi:hypothetical protein
MKNKIIFLCFTVAVCFLGFFLLSPETFNFCKNNCFINPITFGLGQPLFFGMFPFVFVFIILLFIKDG